MPKIFPANFKETVPRGLNPKKARSLETALHRETRTIPTAVRFIERKLCDSDRNDCHNCTAASQFVFGHNALYGITILTPGNEWNDFLI